MLYLYLLARIQSRWRQLFIVAAHHAVISSLVCMRVGSPSRWTCHLHLISHMRYRDLEMRIVKRRPAPGRWELVWEWRLEMPHPSREPRERSGQGSPFRPQRSLARVQIVFCPEALQERRMCSRDSVSSRTWHSARCSSVGMWVQ